MSDGVGKNDPGFGAVDHLGKPFDLDELAARLRALIRRKGGWATATLQDVALELAGIADTGWDLWRPAALHITLRFGSGRRPG